VLRIEKWVVIKTGGGSLSTWQKYCKSWHHGKTRHTLDAIQYHAPKWLQGANNKSSGTKSGIGRGKKGGKRMM
jgi:hypothetical protein